MAAKKSAGPPSAKLAKFGIPVPARIAKFFDGPELAAHSDVKAWGMEGQSADTKFKVAWGAPKLGMIHEYATDGGHFEEGADKKYLPIAALGSETYMFVVDVSDSALPVLFFDYEAGFSKFADDFDSFLGKLLKKGQRTPAEKLQKAYDQATAAHEKKKYTTVIEILQPVVALFPKTMGGFDDTRDTLGSAHNLLGIALEHEKKIDEAVEHYEIGIGLGSDMGGLNMCDLFLNHYKDYAKLVSYGEKCREGYWLGSDTYAWFHVRNYLGQGYLLTGNPKEAIRAYHQIKQGLAVRDPAKIEQAVKDLRECMAQRSETDKQAAEGILAWLDVPAPALPAERIAAFKAWWPKLPDPVKAAIKEAVSLGEKDPADADWMRIAEITDLRVTNAELKNVDWVTMLTKLDDLNVSGNKLTDLTPVAKLTKLTDLDASENKIKSLAPIAGMKRLGRLNMGENPLGTLEGVERLQECYYLHVPETKLTDVEPCRGMESLVELTIYNNKIDDLSPLAECPRLKEISSFGNKLSKGWEALGKLPWLEEVNAGEKTHYKDVQALRAMNPIVDIDDEFCKGKPDDEEEPPPDPELGPAREWWKTVSPEWKKRFLGWVDKDEIEKGEPTDAGLLKIVRQDSPSFEEGVTLETLAPLSMLKRIDYLFVGDSKTTDIGPIAALPRLRDLLVRDNPITSLAPLAASKTLEELYMERCSSIASLAGLEKVLSLREIYAEDCTIEDLGPLADLRELRILDFEANPIRSVAPLKKLRRLKELKLGLTQVTDLSPLADCERLRLLEIWGCPGVKNAVALVELPDLDAIVSHGSLPASEIEEIRRKRPDISID